MLRTARRLDAALRGEPLTASDLRWPSLATVDLAGRTTLEVVARGKHLLHRLSGDLTLHSHLKMEGSWRTYAAASPPPLRDHRIRAVLRTAERIAVGSSLGMLDLVRTADEDRLVGHLGPDILAADFDDGPALTALADDPRPLGAALLDQTVVAGLGTIWVTEAAYRVRVSPWAPARDVEEHDLRTALADVRRRMQAAVDGTGRGGRRHDPGLLAYGRAGLPCRRCGTPIRAAQVGAAGRERTLNYCPRCQGGLAPGDDGAAARRPLPRGRRR